MINSPFKFLDPYGRQDYDIFFGRDEEKKTLYQYIHKNRLVLVYGTSGTGKTSIVQCGLANMMDDTDWTPFFVRRGDNINDSLCAALQKDIAGKPGMETSVTGALSGVTTAQAYTNVIRPRAPQQINDQVFDALKQINLRYLRPVYLIFDQFEELLIMGSDEERKTFIRIIDEILCNPDLQFCNMLFIMREEFFAGLSDFEKEIPDFCDRRLRIEPMNARNVEEVIVRSCEKFSITLQEGPVNAQQIIAILTERNTISLPYLQIYLDQLWRSVYLSSPHPMPVDSQEYPPLTFNTEIIHRFGKMSEVLDRFIRERIHVIQEILDKKYRDLPPDFVSNVLDAFVTPEGTKRPISYLRVMDGKMKSIWFTGQVPPYLQRRSASLMMDCLDELEKNKILRTDGTSYELAHDVLAGLIDSRRTEEQRKANFADQQLRSRYTAFLNKTADYLSRKEIESYRPFIDQLNLPPEIRQFFRDSENSCEASEQTERDREIKLANLKSRQRTWKWVWAIIGLMLAYTAFFYFTFVRREINRNKVLAFMSYDLNSLDPVLALNLFGSIKRKVYAEDTPQVNRKMLEYMQRQDIQSRFSFYSDTLPKSIWRTYDFDISADGRFIAINVTPPGNPGFRGAGQEYNIVDLSGGKVTTYEHIQYVYFTNKDNVLLLSGKETFNPLRDPVSQAKQSINTAYPEVFHLYNCSTGLYRHFVLGAGRYLYPARQVSKDVDSEFDSYRVSFTASGNLIVPLLVLDNKGVFVSKVQLYDPNFKYLRDIPSESTITLSRDRKEFLTLRALPNGYNQLTKFDEQGHPLFEVTDVTFGDFTEDGEVIWGTDEQLHVTRGRDTLTFSTPYRYEYGLGNVAAGKLVSRIVIDETKGESVEVRDILTNKVQYFSEELLATNFGKNEIITIHRGAEDTIFRRDLSGARPAAVFIHSDGIETTQYNRQADELLVLTRKNKILLLDAKLQVKTGLQITANDLYGLSANGMRLYYIRDQYLSLFDNKMDYLNVFDAQKTNALLESGKSPLHREITRQEKKKLKLPF
ncbi:ATP-binding protein [Chitinophaga lutea]